MDKQELLVKVKSKGYKADMSNGIPTVHVECDNRKKAVKEFKAYLNELGYNSSFGIKFDGVLSDSDEDDSLVEDKSGDEMVERPLEVEDVSSNAAAGAVEESSEESVSDAPIEDASGEPTIFDLSMGLDLFDL